MDIQAEKNELVKMLLATDDRSLLKDIRSLFTRKEKEISIPQYVIDGVRESQDQLRKGQGIPYEQIKKEFNIK